jgi:tripeptidyl-peptidase-1
MDSEAILTVAWPIPLTVWQIGGSPPPFLPSATTPTDTNEPYLVWLDYVLNQKDLPYVISTSFGDDEQSVPESYARRACSGFAQLGARGISLFTASGDTGVGANGTCISNDGKKTPRFLSTFPAVSPPLSLHLFYPSSPVLHHINTP